MGPWKLKCFKFRTDWLIRVKKHLQKNQMFVIYSFLYLWKRSVTLLFTLYPRYQISYLGISKTAKIKIFVFVNVPIFAIPAPIGLTFEDCWKPKNQRLSRGFGRSAHWRQWIQLRFSDFFRKKWQFVYFGQFNRHAFRYFFLFFN